MDKMKWLAPMLVMLLACAAETADLEPEPETEPQTEPQTEPDTEPKADEVAPGTQTGGSGGNPCPLADTDWTEVSGELPQVGTWRGELDLSEGGRTPATLSVEQTGPLLRSDSEGCSDLQRGAVEYTLRIDGVLVASRAGELVDQWKPSTDSELGYVGLLTTRIESNGVESGVHVPTALDFDSGGGTAGAPDAGTGGAGGTDAQDRAAPITVDLSVEVIFDADEATVNLTWVCFDCGGLASSVLPLGVATLEKN